MNLPISLSVSIDTWKTKQSSVGNSIYYIIGTDGFLYVFVGNRDFILKSFTSETESEWLDLYPAAQQQYLENDIIALYANLSVLKRTDEGNLIYSPTYFAADEEWRSKGLFFTVSGNSIGINDFQLGNQIRVQGADYWIRSDIDGNEVDFSIVDKDDVLGLHTALGYPLGTPIELSKFVESNYFPGGLYIGSKTSTQASPVLGGLYVRIKYTNNSENPATIGVNYVWYITPT